VYNAHPYFHINILVKKVRIIVEVLRYILANGLLPMPTESVGMGRMFSSVCLSVCPQHNSKTNKSKVLKLGVGNEHGIS